MHAQPPARRVRPVSAPSPLRRMVAVAVGLLVAALVVGWPASAPARAADPRIEKALEQRRQAQQRLDEVLQRLGDLQASVGAAEAELAQLNAAVTSHRDEAQQATTTVALLAQASYRYGSADPTLSLLTSDSPGQALAQARLLGLLAKQGRASYEAASAARIRTQVAAEEAERVAAVLRGRRNELDRARQEAGVLVAAAERSEQSARSTVAAEQAAAQRAAARATARRTAAAQQRPTRAAPLAVPLPTAVTGGIACPVGQPRSFSDTYGAPRSGGRAHKGTDILAPRGTPIYAYESGRITRFNTSRVGGISLYLAGDSGTQYYYTHLQGYAAGVSAGQRVDAGQHIAANGDTGNARGIPHLHFEVMPGGGGNVNPYPYVRRACG
ncbi:MAG TPA: peptidoglycan DD-metalloendopeptidase family protein [Egibacteraceae bacterium]|nr:peptidoglycan DD-metalloendopeptidase family protein [Egibacteraceae bacterium]